MRRIGIAFCASLALFAGACGSDGDTNTNASAGNDGAGDGNAALSASAVSNVCGSREAVAVGAAGASASASASGSVDFSTALEALRRARDVAPSEIRDDFTVIVDAQTPFFEAMARHNGNYMSAAQDPAFAAAAQKMNTDAVQAASQNITEWFTEHCS